MNASTARPAPATNIRPSKALNISLWVGQVILAAMFGMGGAMKAFAPFAVLHAQVPWTNHVPDLMVRFIGLSELAGAIGLLLPAITRIQPRLIPLAALGLMIVMLLATGFHVMRAEYSALPTTLGLAALAAFVAWGRAWKAPIAPRTRTAPA
jgi:putative oxidoreductase